MAKIYVASSWRNTYYPEVVERLREAGHEVYDFRNPPHGGHGFRWTEIDENAPNWEFAQYAEGLHHPKAEWQFLADLEAQGLGKLVEMYQLTPASWSSPAAAAPTPKPAG